MIPDLDPHTSRWDGRDDVATKKTASSDVSVSAIKGFNANLTCRDFQFEIGKTYKHEGSVEACKAGFHCITGHPLAVFQYYAPVGSRFMRVDISGNLHSDDNEKTAAEILKVGDELGLSTLTQEAVAWVTARAGNPEGIVLLQEGEAATGDQGAASATGDQGAASATGDQGAASATGYQGAASATGHQGAASATGSRGAASATGYQGAASATGDQGAASATGTRGAASATGYQGAAISSGYEGRVSGAPGCALFAVERDDNYEIISTAMGIAGKNGIAADTWYLARNGKLVEA